MYSTATILTAVSVHLTMHSDYKLLRRPFITSEARAPLWFPT